VLPETDPLGELVADLRGRLRGPRSVRAALVREVDDGLHDAAAAYREAGLAPAEAARRAAEEFGAPADLAPLYQAELDASQGRRAALLIALTYPTLTLAWDALWRYASTGDGTASGSVTLAARLLDAGSYGAAIAAAVAALLFGRASATWTRRLALGVGTLGWLSLVLSVCTSVWMAQADGGQGAAAMRSSTPGILVVLLTVAASLAVAGTATSTLLRAGRLRISLPSAPVR